MNEWIDIKKDLPKKKELVLCIQDPKKTATKYPLLARFNGKDFIPLDRDDEGFSRWVHIILWSPISKTPAKYLRKKRN